MADQKLTALTEVSVPALTDIQYLVADPGGTPASDKITLARLAGAFAFYPGGRLTLESGVAISTTDQLAKGTLYYTPYIHNAIRIYDATRWKYYVFTEKSLALTLTSGKNYDVFIYDNAGTLTLELSAAWTNDTTRADALTTQDGVYVKSGATTRLWLGTLRASATNQTADSGGDAGTTQVGGTRFVWNFYNQVARAMKVIDTTATWNYTTDSWRVANGATAPTNCVQYVCGYAGPMVRVNIVGTVFLQNNSAKDAKWGVGVDSTSAFSGTNSAGYNSVANGFNVAISAEYAGPAALGYHYLAWLERGADGTCTFVGSTALNRQSGLTAWVMG